MWQIPKSHVLISLQGKQIIQYEELFREKVNGKYQCQDIQKKHKNIIRLFSEQAFMIPLIIQELGSSCFTTVSQQSDVFFHSIERYMLELLDTVG